MQLIKTLDALVCRNECARGLKVAHIERRVEEEEEEAEDEEKKNVSSPAAGVNGQKDSGPSSDTSGFSCQTQAARRGGGREEWGGGRRASPLHRHRRGEEEAGNGLISPLLRVESQNPKTGSWRSHSRAGISRLCSLQPYLLCTWVAATRRRCTF